MGKKQAAEKKEVQVVDKKKIKIKATPKEAPKEEKKGKTPAKKEVAKPKKEAPKPAAKVEKTAASKKPEEKNDRLPGQKYDTPDENDGSRIFYESLLKQNPNSKMAMKWCVEYGVLDQTQAKKYQAILEKKK